MVKLLPAFVIPNPGLPDNALPTVVILIVPPLWLKVTTLVRLNLPLTFIVPFSMRKTELVPPLIELPEIVPML